MRRLVKRERSKFSFHKLLIPLTLFILIIPVSACALFRDENFKTAQRYKNQGDIYWKKYRKHRPALKNYKQALKYFPEYKEVKDTLSEIYTSLGIKSMTRGYYRSARRWFSTALEYNPANKEAQKNLITALNKLGRTKEAETFQKKFEQEEIHFRFVPETRIGEWYMNNLKLTTSYSSKTVEMDNQSLTGGKAGLNLVNKQFLLGLSLEHFEGGSIDINSIYFRGGVNLNPILNFLNTKQYRIAGVFEIGYNLVETHNLHGEFKNTLGLGIGGQFSFNIYENAWIGGDILYRYAKFDFEPDAGATSSKSSAGGGGIFIGIGIEYEF